MYSLNDCIDNIKLFRIADLKANSLASFFWRLLGLPRFSASQSDDPDALPSDNSTLNFAWTCTTTTPSGITQVKKRDAIPLQSDNHLALMSNCHQTCSRFRYNLKLRRFCAHAWWTDMYRLEWSVADFSIKRVTLHSCWNIRSCSIPLRHGCDGELFSINFSFFW